MQSTSSPDPAVDPARIEGMYEDLATMQVELDPDPLALGPKRLNEKIATARGMLSRCETIFLAISQDLFRYKRVLRTAAADFKLQMRELLTNDPEVRMGRSAADRDAIASNRLRPAAEEIDRLTACVEDLNSVLIVVRTKRLDLKDIQGRLKDQLKVCQEELGLGGRWGLVSSRGLPRGKPDPAGDELNSLINDTEAKFQAREQAKSSTPSGTNGSPDEALANVEILSGDLLEESPPDEPAVPFVKHPDNNLFTDGGIDDILKSM